MKNKLMSFLLASTMLFASDIVGVIEKIDRSNKTITVNNTIIQIQPYTQIENDPCFGFDTNIQFKNLKVGDLVEIDTVMYQDIIMADEIEVKCKKNRAY